jgi:4-hydroxybenzoate polyprenyltransferase
VGRTRAGSVFDQLRIARVLMMVIVTGTTAFGFGAGAARIALAAAAAGFLSFGSFLLDHLFDLRKDREGGRASNPFAAGTLPPAAGATIIAVSLACAAGLAALACMPAWWAGLAAAAGVVLVVTGLGLGVLDGPVLRAVSLGVLQGLYALLGGLSAGPAGAGLLLIALFLLLAMTGGRVLGDVRDSGQDARAGTRTIPLRHGTAAAVAFLFCLEAAAWAAGAAAYWWGGLGRGWAWCLAAIAAAGTAINVSFAARPTPRRADIANRLSLGVLGSLYSLGMVLARLLP